jgi:hypothetical protein
MDGGVTPPLPDESRIDVVLEVATGYHDCHATARAAEL